MNLLSKISWKGVIWGAVANVGLSNVWGIILVTYVVQAYGLGSLPPTELMAAILTTLKGSMLLQAANWIVGGGFSILGGYIAARIAKHDIDLNASLSSFLCVLFVLYGIISGAGGQRLWVAYLSIPLNIALAWIGGFVYKRFSSAPQQQEQ